MDIKALAEKYESYIIEQRRWFHAHPELSWEEYKTTDAIAAQLEGCLLYTSFGRAGGDQLSGHQHGLWRRAADRHLRERPAAGWGGPGRRGAARHQHGGALFLPGKKGRPGGRVYPVSYTHLDVYKRQGRIDGSPGRRQAAWRYILSCRFLPFFIHIGDPCGQGGRYWSTVFFAVFLAAGRPAALAPAFFAGAFFTAFFSAGTEK